MDKPVPGCPGCSPKDPLSLEGFIDHVEKQERFVRRTLLRSKRRGSFMSGKVRGRLLSSVTPKSELEPIQGGQEPGRNDPCPCKSGGKYKKCCRDMHTVTTRLALNWLKVNDEDPPIDYNDVTDEEVHDRNTLAVLRDRVLEIQQQGESDGQDHIVTQRGDNQGVHFQPS